MLWIASVALAGPADITRLREAGVAAGAAAWDRLAELCDLAGPRPAGSEGYRRAVEITSRWLTEDGAFVQLEPVTVPVWTRGGERLDLLMPSPRSLPVLALGGSVGTTGVEGSVVVVSDFSELGPHVAGKIVLYNSPMEVKTPAVDGYGAAVQYRVHGASRAARFGAKAVLVRSVTTHSLASPHTGAMRYDPEVPRIPAAAVTVEDAEWMQRQSKRGVDVRVRLELGARDEGTAVDMNVLGELRGRERPEEVVLIGAHLDSWDVGQGAHDDASGVVEVVEALRLIKQHGTPRRTIRVVLFANEEHGLSGGRAYFAAHGGERHVAAFETDLGGGAPIRFEPSGSPAQVAWLRSLAASILPVEGEGGGADISPLEATGTLLIGLLPDDSHYFDVHHTHADTVEKVRPEDLGAAVGAIAALAWELADAPGEAPPAIPKAQDTR